MLTPLGKARAVALAGGLLLAALVLAVGEPAAAQKKKEPHKKEPHKKEPHKKELHKKEPHKKELHKKELHKKGVHKAGVSVPAGVSEADRLRVREALGRLRAAHQLLHATRHGFGGHRQAAEHDTRHAIRQSEQALAFR
jgi:hypothetical protein